MFVAPCEDAIYKSEKVHFWDKVENFDYSPIRDLACNVP